MREFTDLQRIEYQAELSRYCATDSSISDIAIYMADRGAVLCQRGWFTESEYIAFMRSKCNLDLNMVLEAAKKRSSINYFGEAEYNRGEGDIALVSSLVNVESPSASLIILLDRNNFNQSIAKLGGDDILGIEVLNLSGESVFRTSTDIPDGWRVEINSDIFPLTYQVTCPNPSSIWEEDNGMILVFILIMFLLLALALLLSFLLSWHNIRPLQNLAGRLENVAGSSFDNANGLTEFEQIENSFMSLYSKNMDLQGSMEENEKQARQYALLLILSGDGKFVEKGQSWFETLDIPFTDQQVFSVWTIWQKTESGGWMDVQDMFMELQPEMESVEEVCVGAGQSILIIGYDPEKRPFTVEETVEQIRLFAMEQQNVLLKIETEETAKPGIAGISQAYYRLLERLKQQEECGEADLRGKEIIAYIDQHYCEPDISLKELSFQWNLSVSTVSRLCKETVGDSFLSYLTSLRLQKAKELLLNPKNTPAIVAEAVGYTSEYSFRRAFSRSENCKVQDWMAKNRIAE